MLIFDDFCAFLVVMDQWNPLSFVNVFLLNHEMIIRANKSYNIIIITIRCPFSICEHLFLYTHSK